MRHWRFIKRQQKMGPHNGFTRGRAEAGIVEYQRKSAMSQDPH
ncbi:hypothetical protein PATSB16_14220 [Pandoraea thiooxydans]|nr:hypothetical protein PATSB16_14220 [Pandoraea thiooxydans]